MALTAGRHTAEAAGEPFTENRERRERLSPPTSEEEQETVAKSPEVLQRRISCQIQKKNPAIPETHLLTATTSTGPLCRMVRT